MLLEGLKGKMCDLEERTKVLSKDWQWGKEIELSCSGLMFFNQSRSLCSLLAQYGTSGTEFKGIFFVSCWEYENSGLSWTHPEKITSSSNSSSGTKKGMYSYYNFCLFFIVLREFFWKFRKNHESEMEVPVIQGVNPCYTFLLKYFEFLQWNIYNLIIMSKVFIFL